MIWPRCDLCGRSRPDGLRSVAVAVDRVVVRVAACCPDCYPQAVFRAVAAVTPAGDNAGKRSTRPVR